MTLVMRGSIEFIVLDYKKRTVYRHYYENMRASNRLTSGDNYNLVISDEIFDSLENDPIIDRVGIANFIKVSLHKSGSYNKIYKNKICQFLSNYIKNPQLEQLAKVDYLTPILKRNVDSVRYTNEASNIADIMGMGKGLLKKMAQKNIFDFYDFKDIKMLYKSYKKTIKSDEEFLILFDILENWTNVSTSRKKNLLDELIRLGDVILENKYNIRPKNILEYVQRCHRYQAISCASVSVPIWKDYTKRAKSPRF